MCFPYINKSFLLRYTHQSIFLQPGVCQWPCTAQALFRHHFRIPDWSALATLSTIILGFSHFAQTGSSSWMMANSNLLLHFLENVAIFLREKNSDFTQVVQMWLRGVAQIRYKHLTKFLTNLLKFWTLLDFFRRTSQVRQDWPGLGFWLP